MELTYGYLCMTLEWLSYFCSLPQVESSKHTTVSAHSFTHPSSAGIISNATHKSGIVPTDSQLRMIYEALVREVNWSILKAPLKWRAGFRATKDQSTSLVYHHSDASSVPAVVSTSEPKQT